MTRHPAGMIQRSENTGIVRAGRRAALGAARKRSGLERALFARLRRVLRLGTEPRTPVDFAIAVSQGLETGAADALVEEGLVERRELDVLVPRRTLSHRREHGERLKRGESDAVARVAKVVMLAEHVFGERERAGRWLRSPKKAYRGRTPFEMLDSSEGAQLVEEALVRVDEGYFA